MEPHSNRFKAEARVALHDPALQAALGKFDQGWIAKRKAVIARFPEFEALREEGAAIKDHVLQNLDYYLERYEKAVIEAGGHVHWARDAAEARNIIMDICRRVGARSVTRGKSMAGEEIGIAETLEEAGIRVVETDLGEYIIQIAKQRPSHIVFPCVHMTKDEVVELFKAHHEPRGFHGPRESVADLVNEARDVLRDEYFIADVGITGANFLIAETGSHVLVTNEGNGDLTSTLSRCHIVTAPLERVVPTLEDATTLLRLLGRSATAQELTAYTTLYTGPKRPGDLDGPEQFHVVLIDNGRTEMLAGEYRDMLRCIRCGACMNHCPVYGAIGGHPYGWVYPGPMGAVLTPLLVGLEQSRDLPNACTLNGRCQQVCPVKIPLPKLLRQLRARQFERHLTTFTSRYGLKAWAFVAKRPILYRLATRLASGVLARLGGRMGRIGSLPFASGWTGHRDFPAPPGRTFFDEWNRRQSVRNGS